MSEILQEVQFDSAVRIERTLSKQQKLLEEQDDNIRKMSDRIAMGERRMVHLLKLMTRSTGQVYYIQVFG